MYIFYFGYDVFHLALEGLTPLCFTHCQAKKKHLFLPVGCC